MLVLLLMLFIPLPAPVLSLLLPILLLAPLLELVLLVPLFVFVLAPLLALVLFVPLLVPVLAYVPSSVCALLLLLPTICAPTCLQLSCPPNLPPGRLFLQPQPYQPRTSNPSLCRQGWRWRRIEPKKPCLPS